MQRDTVGTVSSAVRPDADAAGQASAIKPGVAVLALNAALLTMIGSSMRGDLIMIGGVPITVAAAIVGWTATRSRRGRTLSSTWLLLAAAAGTGLGAASPGRALWYELLYHLYPAAGVIAIGFAAGGSPRQRDSAVIALSVLAMILFAVSPIAVRVPSIDVWSWIQAAGQALLHGTHPYTVKAVDIYHGAFDFGSTPGALPYTPGTVLLSTPFIAMFGDYRVGLVLAFGVTLLLIRAAAARLNADPDVTAAATLALVLHPRGAFMMAVGFPDFFLIATAAAFLYFAASRRPVAEAIAVFLLPAIKQYAAVPVVLYIAMRRRWRPILIGAIVAAATVLPFVIWNPGATLAGVLFLLRAPIPLRIDSTSVAALVALAWGLDFPRWVAVAAQFAAGAIAWTLLRDRGAGGLLLASALALLVCFLVATQAFINYYAFAAALFLLAAIAFSARAVEPWA